MKNLVGLLFLALIVLASCQETLEKSSKSMDGVYESVGYCRIVKVEDGEYILANMTTRSCIPLMEGIFSDILDKVLPNGWEFGLSNEVYLDMGSNNWEGKGIPPDIEIGYNRDTQEFLQKVVDGLESEGDHAIEKAISLIE